ncbi:EamA-like transporter family protein [Paenibacillus sp. BC26]|nr:EamA-like transporter family protein [Paenibacillus sp. BC26]
MMIAYIAMCLIFGTTFLSIEIGIEGGMPPFFFAGARFFLAGVIILFLLRGAKSLKHPIFTTLLAMWTGQKKRSLQLVIGIALGFIGTYLVATGTSHETSSGGEKKMVYAGIALLLFIKFIYALALTRFQKHTSSVPSMTSNGLQMIVGSLFLLLLSICFEHVTPSEYSPAALGALAYLIVFGSVVGYSIFYWLLRVTNAVFPTTFTFISPVIAMYVGVLFMNEEFTIAMGIGAGTVISSVVFLSWGVRGKSKRLQMDVLKSDS